MRGGAAGFGGVMLGVLIALLSSVIVVGSFILAITEGGGPLGFVPSPTPVEVSLLTPLSSVPTALPASPTFTETSLPSETPTLTPSLTLLACTPEPGWVSYIINDNDTLKSLADYFGLRKQVLLDGNCMEGDLPSVGSAFLVPYAIAASDPSSCVRPVGWLNYYVKPGDLLWNIARRIGITVQELAIRNCIGVNSTIYVNQVLFVPRIPYPLPPPATIPPYNTPIPPAPTSPPPTQPIPPTNPPPTPTNGNISNQTDTP